ncbi:hypothetical protein Adu01nite_07470 [Paractinoplanes durhamensis]|uniref:Uncharacterized protein n=1 Tax=Paractinoplanes durhamensis TaxID=113563 RepID=A0ABQ3YPB5_9ACTN|nr:hypothetical protein Adu01nite_07470 [Actinoplanes durhamensis]
MPAEMVRPRPKRLPVERDSPRLGNGKPADHIEERRLAGPVGPDHPNNAPRRNPKRNIVKSKKPTKANGDVMKGKSLVSVR